MSNKDAILALLAVMTDYKVSMEPDIYGGMCLRINGKAELHFKCDKCLVEYLREYN